MSSNPHVHYRRQKQQQQELQRRLEVLERAVQVSPGGGLVYVPVGQQQGILGQTFYGGTMKNIPVGTSAIYSPGVPLPPQPNVDPQGKPVQFRFPVSYNTFPVDRTLGKPDIPSFEQLRRLAKMYDGITLNERYWMDMVPRMKLGIRLKQQYLDMGAEDKQYQKEITAFRNFWDKPDGKHDLHTWLRMMLREQSQIDELYLYKHRTRGRKMLGYWVIAGDQMKPLLDDWGMQPDAPNYAYQQYPWGIPGMQYSAEMMIHYQESPAADTPYGFSRVERVIFRVNEGLRKIKKDIAHFTEGNIPQSFMEVPEALNWTPDQIDAYEQSWNALIAGSPQQQVRMKFLQPGMKYIKAEDYELLSDFDLFIFRITCGSYGVPPTEYGFTDTANRATSEEQEDMVYRRTIGPNADTYAAIMTRCMAEDFPPEMKGEMFECYFYGFEEVEDEAKKATAITTYTGAGVLGLTDAAKKANLPVDPDAPPIGRVIITKSGPIFLDDYATPEMRQAQQQAALAGYQLAANPQPAPVGNEEEDKGDAAEEQAEQNADNKKAGGPVQKSEDKETMNRVLEVLERAEEALRLAYERNAPASTVPLISQQGSCTCETCTANAGQPIKDGHAPPYHDGCDCKAVEGDGYVERASPKTKDTARHRPRSGGDLGRGTGEAATSSASDGAAPVGAAGLDSARSADYRRWRSRALEDVKAGRVGRLMRQFVSDVIPIPDQVNLAVALRDCATPDEVRAVFDRARNGSAPEDDGSPKDAPPDSGAWQATDSDVQAVLDDYRARGVVELEWQTAPAGVCDQCARNAGQRVKVGMPFATGARVPRQHPHCDCTVVLIYADGTRKEALAPVGEL